MSEDFYIARYPYMVTGEDGETTRIYGANEWEAKNIFCRQNWSRRIAKCERDYDQSEVELAMLVCYQQKQLHGDTAYARQRSARILGDCKLSLSNLLKGAKAVFGDWKEPV